MSKIRIQLRPVLSRITRTNKEMKLFKNEKSWYFHYLQNQKGATIKTYMDYRILNGMELVGELFSFLSYLKYKNHFMCNKFFINVYNQFEFDGEEIEYKKKLINMNNKQDYEKLQRICVKPISLIQFFWFNRMYDAGKYIFEQTNLKGEMKWPKPLLDQFCGYYLVRKEYAKIAKLYINNDYYDKKMLDSVLFNLRFDNLEICFELIKFGLNKGHNFNRGILNGIIYRILILSSKSDTKAIFYKYINKRNNTLIIEIEEIIKLIIEYKIKLEDRTYTLLFIKSIQYNLIDKTMEYYNLLIENQLAKPNLIFYSIFIHAYLNEDQLDKAALLIKQMKKDNINYNNVILGSMAFYFINKKQMDMVDKIFTKEYKHDLISSTMLIKANLLNKQEDKAIDIFQKIEQPDHIAFNYGLSAHYNKEMEEIKQFLINNPTQCNGNSNSNSIKFMLKMAIKNMDYEIAFQIFNSLKYQNNLPFSFINQKIKLSILLNDQYQFNTLFDKFKDNNNAFTLNLLILGTIKFHLIDNAFSLLDYMIQNNLQPNHPNLLSLLQLASKLNRLDMVQMLLNLASKYNYLNTPSFQHGLKNVLDKLKQ